jgi:hypothetical protein
LLIPAFLTKPGRFGTYKISQRAGYGNLTAAEIATRFGAPFFAHALEDFLRKECPRASTSTFNSAKHGSFAVFKHFSRILPSPFGNKGSAFVDRVTVRAATKKKAAFYETVLFVDDPATADVLGIKGKISCTKTSCTDSSLVQGTVSRRSRQYSSCRLNYRNCDPMLHPQLRTWHTLSSLHRFKINPSRTANYTRFVNLIRTFVVVQQLYLLTLYSVVVISSQTGGRLLIARGHLIMFTSNVMSSI